MKSIVEADTSGETASREPWFVAECYLLVAIGILGVGGSGGTIEDSRADQRYYCRGIMRLCVVVWRRSTMGSVTVRRLIARRKRLEGSQEVIEFDRSSSRGSGTDRKR